MTATVTERTVDTDRVRTRLLERGDGEPVLFVHGNVSFADLWAEQLERLPDGYHGFAPDLRGYGGTEARPIDATRGLRDWSDDLASLVPALGHDRLHLVGHSLGAGVALRFALDHPAAVRSLVLVVPLPPYGFGGTRPDGSPCTPDFAGSGAGLARPELVERMAAGDRSTESRLSPRSLIRWLFFPDPAVVRSEEAILAGMLSTHVGEDFYPGDVASSPHWPGFAPGTRGVNNALSPRYCDLSALADSGLRAPVLWVRGDADAVVSDASTSDAGHLGSIGAIPGWPGEAAFPPQRMLTQTRAVLDRYQAAGGSYREEVMAGTGHFPYTQQPDAFAALLTAHLEASAAAEVDLGTGSSR